MKIVNRPYRILILTLTLFFSLLGFGQQSSLEKKPKLLIPFGHQYGIEKTIFSQDYKLLITSDEAITIISDVRSGKPLYYLDGINPSISADGNYIATAKKNLVLIWTVTGGKLLNELKLDEGIEASQLTFNTAKNIILVQAKHSASEDSEPEIETDNPLDEVSIWNYTSGTRLHKFNSKKEDGEATGTCTQCSGYSCPIYGAWFNISGDSIRLAYENLVKSFAVGNYSNASRVCLINPGKKNNNNSSKLKILDGNIIEKYDDETAYCFTENGRMIGSWNRHFKISMGASSETEKESISPTYNYHATYTSSRIKLRNLANSTEQNFEVEAVKKLSFNNSGTYVLIEYFNESPRIFSTADFSEPAVLPEKDFEGFPTYVYVTKTVSEADQMITVVDNMEEKMAGAVPKMPGILEKFFPMPNIKESIDPMFSKMKKDTKNAYTNSGEIINLYSRRTISKIQSLIKLSGDIKLSPDKKIMLLNTEKVISVYSIPYAKLLINLKPTMSSGVDFSPNSKWLVQFFADSGRVVMINLVTGKTKNAVVKFEDKHLPKINFSTDSKTVTISSNTGQYKTFNLENPSQTKEGPGLGGYYISKEGDKYGFTNSSDGTVHIYRQKDSVEIFTLDLAEKNSEKKKKKQQAKQYNYRISFGGTTNSVLIWNERIAVYVKDINNPADTILINNKDLLEDEENYAYCSNATLSPNGIYINFQLNVGPCFIYNIKRKEITVIAGLELLKTQVAFKAATEGFGKMLRQISTGNTQAILAKEIAEFSSTGDSLLVCFNDSAIIYSCAEGKRLNGFKTNGEIKYFSLKNNLLISYYYGQLLFSSIIEKKEWFSMIPFNNGETVYLLPDGTFFGSKSVTRHLGYIYDDKSLSYKQFDFNSNRPDIILRALGNTDKKYLAIYDSALSIRQRREGLKDQKALNFSNAPQVFFANDKTIKGEVTEKELSLSLNIRGANEYPDRLAVYINGNPVFGSKGIRLSHKAYSIDTSINVSLTEGKNIVEVSVFDMAGTESYRQPLYILYSPINPVSKNIYFAGIGAAKYSNSGKNLNWAKKDITDVLDSLRSHYPNHVIVDTLFNSKVTIENLKKLKTKFAKSQPDDIVIIYYSGHGEIAIDKAEAFFGTYDMDFSNPSKRGISIRDLNDLMEDIPARNKAVFLDACHSGEISTNGWQANKPVKNNAPNKNIKAATNDDELDNMVKKKGEDIELRNPGETDAFDLVLELFTDLYQGNGTNIIVAARGLEAAKECNEIEHGVFTYCVLNGISKLKADADSNSILSIGELQNYVIKTVPVASNFCETSKTQRASTRKENEFNDWAIVDNSSAAIKKKSIVTKISADSKQNTPDTDETPAIKTETKNKEDDSPIKLPGNLDEIKKTIEDAKKRLKKKIPF